MKPYPKNSFRTTQHPRRGGKLAGDFTFRYASRAKNHGATDCNNLAFRLPFTIRFGIQRDRGHRYGSSAHQIEEVVPLQHDDRHNEKEIENG